MALSPDSLPGILLLTPILPSLPLSPPAESPPSPPESSSSPPPPPPEESPPPPEDTSPPPAEPTSPPPPPPSPPPPSPPITSLPPQSPPSQPPPSSQDSPPPVLSPPPPPPPQDKAPPPAPAAVLIPPPAPSPPAPASRAPENSRSPPAPSTDSSAPPPTSSRSPPAPPTPSHTPPADQSSPDESTPRPISASENPASGVPVKSISSHSDGRSGSDNGEAVRTGVALGVVAAVVIIAFMMVVLLIRRRKRREKYNSIYMMPSSFTLPAATGSSFMKQHSGGGGGPATSGEFSHSSSDIGISNSKAWFTYEELSKATNGFASQHILGAGGFGCVYKGWLQDGREVAVKKLKDASGQGDREFKAEVEIISRVHHRHLVILVGYCITDYQRLLVYEFVPNNTLYYHLHATNKPVMQWSFRVKVACGSARGLAYLHEDCHPRIIHRDIKSANILLDNNFEAKVADFGLAKLAQELELNTHISTRVMGTFGYMAPEYASSGKLTEKSDVFSYGVVLLELITGRKPVDETRPLGDESLVEWARPIMTEALDSQNFDELADVRLEGNYDRGEMFRMIEAAAACVRHSASKRPKMSQVARALDTMNELSDLSNGMKPGQSGIIDSREQSAQIRMFQRMAFGTQEFSSSEYNHSRHSSWMSGGRSGQL